MSNSVDELPAERYKMRDCDGHIYYITVSGWNNNAQEIFNTYRQEGEYEMYSKLANLTALTRMASRLLRLRDGSHIVCKQLKRSSRRKNDIPDILHQAINKFEHREKGV